MLALEMMRFGTESADRVPMMGWLGDGTGIWFYALLWLVTWILIIAVLVALLRWLWKKGDGIRK